MIKFLEKGDQYQKILRVENCSYCVELREKMLFIVNLLISYKESLRRGLPYRESKLNFRKRNSREKLSKGLFIWSRIAETTLPPSYPGRDIFPLICLQIYIVYMRWVRQLGMASQLGEVSCLASAGRVTRVGEKTFSQVNGLARPPGTRQ